MVFWKLHSWGWRRQKIIGELRIVHVKVNRCVYVPGMRGLHAKRSSLSLSPTLCHNEDHSLQASGCTRLLPMTTGKVTSHTHTQTTIKPVQDALFKIYVKTRQFRDKTAGVRKAAEDTKLGCVRRFLTWQFSQEAQISRLSQRCSSGLRSSRIMWRVTGWLVPDV